MYWVLNVIFPGSGLVLLRREWLGLVLAALFTVCTCMFIAGQWIAPIVVPQWLTILCLALACMTWALAQGVGVLRKRELTRRASAASDFFHRGQALVASGELIAAVGPLESAQVLEPERSDILLALAQVHHELGQAAARDEIGRKILRVAPNSAAANSARSWLDLDHRA